MNIQTQGSKTTVRNLAIFTVLILASGWVGHGLDVLLRSPASESPGMLLWIVTPLVVTLLLRAFGGDGWKDFGIKPNFKENWAWYTVAILVFPVLTALVLLVGSGLGWIQFPNLSANSLGVLLQAFALGLVPQFIKNILEEAPWRGHLAPKVYSLGLPDFAGHALVGLVWGAWHIPYYLFFLDRAVLSNFTTLDVAVYIPLAIGVMMSWAIVYGEIRLLTNSFWPAVVMHMVEDAFLVELFTGNHIQIQPGTDWLVSPMNGLLMAFFFIALGVGLRQIRKRRSQLPKKTALNVSVSGAVR